MPIIKNDLEEEFEIDEDCFLVDGVLIKVSLDDIIERDVEGFLDLVSEDAGFPLLTEQTVEIEGHEGSNLLLRVKGNVSMELDFRDDGWDS